MTIRSVFKLLLITRKNDVMEGKLGHLSILLPTPVLKMLVEAAEWVVSKWNFLMNYNLQTSFSHHISFSYHTRGTFACSVATGLLLAK